MNEIRAMSSVDPLTHTTLTLKLHKMLLVLVMLIQSAAAAALNCQRAAKPSATSAWISCCTSV